MTKRTLAAWCSVAYVWIFAAPSVLAQCSSGYIELERALAQDSVALVFSGTVTSVEHAGFIETVSFHAERAWKGPVTPRITIYKMIPADTNTESALLFEPGKRYIVIAHSLSATERGHLGLADGVDAFGTDTCGDGTRLFSIAGQDLRRIGPGRQPVDQRPSVRDGAVTDGAFTAANKIKDVAPVYPEEARAAGIRGVVIVEITLDATGRVGGAKILRSKPLLDQAAIDCVMKWEFLPALVRGVPVPSIMAVTVNFPP